MGARINNFPTYVVYDRSYDMQKTITLTGTATTAQDQNFNYIYDGDITTPYHYVSTNTTNALSSATILLDFGKTFWNCQLGYNIAYSTNTPTNASITLEYSADGVTWVNLVSDTINNETRTYSTSLVTLQLRYIRSKMETATQNTSQTQNFYELRLMGSG